MKKRILVLILCMFSFLLCGCGVKPQYTIAQKSDGAVMQMVYLPFSGAELSNAGVTFDQIAELSNELKGTFNNYFLNKYTNFVTKVEIDPGLSEPNKMAMLSGCPGQEDMNGEGTFSGISYEFNFASAFHYYYFNSSLYYEELVEKLNEDTSVVQEGIFVDKTVTTSISVYGMKTSLDPEKTLAEYVTEKCRLTLKEKTDLTDEKIEELVPKTYIYRYGTATKKLHSNADLVRAIDGVYYHEWNISVDNSQREIATYKITVNKNAWYAGLILVAIALVTVLLIVAKVKDGKDKPKPPKIIIEQPK